MVPRTASGPSEARPSWVSQTLHRVSSDRPWLPDTFCLCARQAALSQGLASRVCPGPSPGRALPLRTSENVHDLGTRPLQSYL